MRAVVDGDPTSTTMRKRRIRLSDEEKNLLRTTRQEAFGDDNVPYGVVVRKACRSLLAEKKDDSGVSF